MQHEAPGDRRIAHSPIPPQDFKSLFYVWLDDDPRRPLEQQLATACAAYARRFGRSPSVILMGPMDAGSSAPLGVTVEVRAYIRPCQYWLRIDAGVELV
jgi:hypothetical protein